MTLIKNTKTILSFPCKNQENETTISFNLRVTYFF